MCRRSRCMAADRLLCKRGTERLLAAVGEEPSGGWPRLEKNPINPMAAGGCWKRTQWQQAAAEKADRRHPDGYQLPLPNNRNGCCCEITLMVAGWLLLVWLSPHCCFKQARTHSSPLPGEH